MSLEIGTKLGYHEIISLLGKGGMGEVYRARDTKLKRDVAIKILPDEFSLDPSRVSRFQREAEILASLNHPNIAAIYDLQEANDIRFLVLELVEGDTLADRIARGAIAIEEAIDIAKHICEALEAAREKGIVHRDLKPANVKITSDGRVKVLDFGLAKAMETTSSAGTLSNSPTLTIGATQGGVILGTAAYMSPEQAKGFEVDARSDTFSFGSVLYEMLTGRQAFLGDTVAEVLASVLVREPDFTLLPPNLNPRLQELLQRCLQKNPKRRWQAVGDLRTELEIIGQAPRASNVAAERPQRFWKKAVPWTVAVLAAAALALVSYLHFTEQQARVLKLSVLFPEKANFNPGSLPAVSPDGRHIAYAVVVEGQQRLWVRDLDSSEARLLAGTDGAIYPFWSPDSRWIAFFDGGRLKKVEAAGGPITPLCNAPGGRGGTWNRDNVILFGSQASGLFQVSADGGNALPITVVDTTVERYHRTPWFLPDGQHFLYTALNTDSEKTAIYLADLKSANESRDRRLIMRANSNAVYVAPGYLLFARDGILLAQRFDARSAQTTGDAIRIADQIDTYTGSSQAEFSVSQTGVLAYTSTGTGSTLQLTWFDRSGRATGTVGRPGDVSWPRISPDGSTVAYSRREAEGPDIWLFDLARGSDSRFASNFRTKLYPTWSKDSDHILFETNQNNKSGLIVERAISGAAKDNVIEEGTKARPADWYGKYIIEATFPNFPKTGSDVWILPLFGDKKSYPYANSEYSETHPRLSPDGQWLAYVSNESKRDEVWVGTFPMPGGKWQVSINGGTFPVWNPSGKELYFIGADGKLMAVEIKGGPKFERGIPTPLFNTVGLATGDYAAFDVSKDGRFLMNVSANQASTVPMTLVVNWTEALKK